MQFRDLFGESIDLLKAGNWGLEDMHDYGKNPLFYKFMETSPHTSIEQTLNYLNGWIEKEKSGKGFLWLIVLKSNKKVIGSISLWDIHKSRRSVGYGYGLSVDYQGKGYVEEGLKLVFDYLFCELNFHRVHGIVSNINIPSLIITKKFGFKKEGILRDYYYYTEYGWDDGILVSMLKNEYKYC